MDRFGPDPGSLRFAEIVGERAPLTGCLFEVPQCLVSAADRRVGARRGGFDNPFDPFAVPGPIESEGDENGDEDDEDAEQRVPEPQGPPSQPLEHDLDQACERRPGEDSDQQSDDDHRRLYRQAMAVLE
ncbi:MAG: hypothetical protein ACHQCF_06815 [Solirubrobacterales bacterium]